MDLQVTELAGLVANVGFPIMTTGYLLFRFETKIDKLTEAIYAIHPPKLTPVPC